MFSRLVRCSTWVYLVAAAFFLIEYRAVGKSRSILIWRAFFTV